MMNERDDEQPADGLDRVDVDDERLPRAAIGTGGSLHCPTCDSVKRHVVVTKKGTVAYQCDDCDTIYTGDRQ